MHRTCEKGEDNMEFDLERFRRAQEGDYETALREIRNGEKESHWIWYIFPQIRGLGQSSMATYYEIQGWDEAVAYWNDPLLSGRLVEITRELLKHDKPIRQIMGSPDHLKLRSCMTLFYLVSRERVFMDVLEKFYGGAMDMATINALA